MSTQSLYWTRRKNTGGGTIIYGQGNFLFDDSESEFWQTSLLIQIGDRFEISYIPLKKDGYHVRLANKNETETIISEFCQRNLEIEDSAILHHKYVQFAASSLDSYLLSLSGCRDKLLFRVINKLSNYRFGKWFIKKRYNNEDLLVIQNYVQCEAHNELLSQGVKIIKH